MNERKPARGSRGVGLNSPLLIALLAVGIVFFILMGVKALKDKSPEPTEPAPELSSTAATESTQESSLPVPDTTAPVSSEQTEPVPTTTEVPPTTEPPARMMTVDDNYFADALFIGDSRTDGLRLYSNPGDAKNYCGTSMTIFKVMDTDIEAYGYTGIRNLLKGMHFGKIYIMFGINECGYNTGAFADKFRSVVEEIRSYQPDALIYIQSICYVTQNHEAKYPVFATANIKEKNEALKALANDVDIFYLEVNDALNDGTDHLPSEYTGDGVHLKASCYRYWHDYLLEHAVVDAQHPWSAGESPEGAEIENP